MKKQKMFITAILLTLTFAVLAFIPAKPKPIKCITALTYSQLATIQFRKAAKANNIDEAKSFIKVGMDKANQAANYALQCNCTQSQGFAVTAHSLAKKVYENGTDLEKMKSDIKTAAVFSNNAMTAAQKCDK